jgi:hypothetical protein
LFDLTAKKNWKPLRWRRLLAHYEIQLLKRYSDGLQGYIVSYFSLCFH